MQPEPVARLDDHRAISKDAYPWTDAGNAERFVARHGEEIRYCEPWRRWLTWDGRRWRVDDTGDIVRRAKDTTRAMLVAAVDSDDKGFRAHALATERETRIRAMISLAQSARPVVPDELDAHPWLLNTLAGTIDLRTGKIAPHDRSHLLTKLAPVNFDPAASAARWDAFLERIFAGDEEFVGFVRRLVGVSLTGTPGAQKLPICWGGGANGKSTFLAVLQRVLGDYAHQAPPELLMLRDGVGGATPDLADLQGRRFVATIETAEGRRLDEALVKALTGGDAITARKLYGQPFTFQPSHTIWLATNHKPEVRGGDLALWRRLALVHFTVTIAPEEQRNQHDLIAELVEEGGGILAWAVRGCLEWQVGGLAEPATVSAATSGYREEQDVLAGFIADVCVVHPNARAKAGDLYNAYSSWCGENHERAIPQRGFGMRLHDRGFTDTRTGKARWWQGIGLLSDRTPDDALTHDDGSDATPAEPIPANTTNNPETVTDDGRVTELPETPPSAHGEGKSPEEASPSVTRHNPAESAPVVSGGLARVSLEDFRKLGLTPKERE